MRQATLGTNRFVSVIFFSLTRDKFELPSQVKKYKLNRPTSILRDKYSEELAYLGIFLGQKRLG